MSLDRLQIRGDHLSGVVGIAHPIFVEVAAEKSASSFRSVSWALTVVGILLECNIRPNRYLAEQHEH